MKFICKGAYHVETNSPVENIQTLIRTTSFRCDGCVESWGHFANRHSFAKYPPPPHPHDARPLTRHSPGGGERCVSDPSGAIKQGEEGVIR
jgi:hypothetical protein